MNCFQVFSQGKDCLVLVYDCKGNVETCRESRGLAPNQLGALRLTHTQLPGFCLSPSEYKKARSAWLKD